MRLASALLAAFGLLAASTAAAQTTGRTVYESVCIACHASENVMVSSPKLGDQKEWRERMARAGGLDGLVRNAVQGVGAMPARGGKPELNAEQLRAAIRYMMQAD
ncbi:Cytochrome c5 [Duganella sp. CF458]|uniref:c-type cytochrome n=1 Tax=Duganella sp. CF458 TaxID=1884368 RepID=UPI0008E3AD59|nr:c-type cytochrome [Duganella sp. CF458]SFF92208.1 Cytochrome c5 [Duganella sp. CF458]